MTLTDEEELLYCVQAHFKYSGREEQKRWDRVGPAETK